MFQGLKHLFSLSFIKLMKNHYLSVDYAVMWIHSGTKVIITKKRFRLWG